MELLRRPKTYSVGRLWEIRLNHLHIVAFCKSPMFKLKYLSGKNSLRKKLSWMKRILNNPFWYKSSLLHQSIAKQIILCSLGIIPKQALHERRMNYDTISRIINGDFIHKVAIFFIIYILCYILIDSHVYLCWPLKTKAILVYLI